MKLYRSLFGIICILFLAIGPVHAERDLGYLGIDILSSTTKFKSGYGAELFNQKSAAQFNLFVGHYFSKLLGFEIGYQQDTTRKSTSTVNAGSSEFNVPNFSGIATQVYATKKSLRGVNLSYVPAYNFSEPLSIIGVLGLTLMRVSAEMNLSLFDGTPPTPTEQNNYYVRFKKTKLVPRVGLRLQYLLSSKFGVRASYLWENTAALKPTAVRNISPAQTLQAKVKDSSSVGIGAFVKF
jgi:hypothetical protein